MAADVATQVHSARGLGRPPERAVIEGPQLLTFLAQQVGSAMELRARLVSLNRGIRGAIPPPPNDGCKEPALDKEMNFAAIVKGLAAVLDQCHSELNEASGLMT